MGMTDESNITTVEDVGYTKEDWIPVFQPVETLDILENKHVPDRLTQDTFIDHGHERSYSNGGQIVYTMAPGAGSLDFEFGPSLVEEGLMVRGGVNFSGPIQGDPVDQVYETVVDNHPAPYLEPRTGEILRARLELPEDYDQAAWEDTLTAAAGILQDAQHLQDTLLDTVDAYEP